jgi:hypothetical protein
MVRRVLCSTLMPGTMLPTDEQFFFLRGGSTTNQMRNDWFGQNLGKNLAGKEAISCRVSLAKNSKVDQRLCLFVVVCF